MRHKKQKKTVKVFRANAQWVPTETANLVDMYTRGFTTKRMASKLGRTIRAVQTKITIMRLATAKLNPNPQSSLSFRADQVVGMPPVSSPGLMTVEDHHKFCDNQKLKVDQLTRVEKAQHLHPAMRPMVPDQPADIAKAHQDDMDRCDYFLVDTMAADGAARIEGFGTIYAMNQAMHTYAGSQVSRMVPMKRLPLAMMVIDD